MRTLRWLFAFPLLAACSSAGESPSKSDAFEPPVPDDCITDVSPGDHTFTCGGITFAVMIDEQCTRTPCGLIFDVHGAAMTGEVQRQNTRLHQLAPPEGYLTVHPSANGTTWDLVANPPVLADFMTRMVDVFHVDEKRVHFTGFSMGSGMTFWFLCNHREVLASVAPVTGASADQVTVAGTDEPCIPSIDADWEPRPDILFMSGIQDQALTIDAARARTSGLVDRLGLSGGDAIENGEGFTRKRWTGDDGMVFEYLEHDYANDFLQGHCIPGGNDGGYIGCTRGGDLDWGPVALDWFKTHPKQ